MKALIVGYGRAGKRHARLLDEFGVDWKAYDPYTIGVSTEKEFELNSDESWDFLVICTPPDRHLDYIKTGLEFGVPVLCEKPLCAFGQLDEARNLLNHSNADKVMVAFNCRFHEDWRKVFGDKVSWENKTDDWTMISYQYRPELPSWGLLLDHLPHTYDRLFWLGGDFKVLTAREVESPQHKAIKVTGVIDNRWNIEIHDEVVFHEVKPFKLNLGPFGKVRPIGNGNMFHSMYEYFLNNLNGPLYCDLQAGIQVQEELENTLAALRSNRSN